MNYISKENFKIQYPNSPDEQNTGVNYSSRLNNLEDVTNTQDKIDDIKLYVTKNLSELKNEIINKKNVGQLKNSYEKVKTQRQTARWINTQENRGNTKIMNKNNFKEEAQKLNIQEINDQTGAYQIVFILLKKLGYLNQNININKSISRKNQDEKEKFMALVKFQAEEQGAKYNTETAKEANSGKLLIDGIIGGGTLKALIENYKLKQNGNTENNNNNTNDETTNIPESQEQTEQNEQTEILENTVEFTGFKLGDNNSSIYLEGYGKLTNINPENMETSNTLKGNSYDILISKKNINVTKDIRVKKADTNNTNTRIYYKKENNKWIKKADFKTNIIDTEAKKMKTNIEVIDANIAKINTAKINFETNMNNIYNINNKSWRNYTIEGGNLGGFEGKNLRETKSLTTSGTKKLKFKEHRLSTKHTEININFDYSIENGFDTEGSYKLDNKTTINYKRNITTNKLDINETINKANKETNNEDNESIDIAEDILGLSKETISKEDLNLIIDGKKIKLNLKNFKEITETKDKYTKTTNIFTIDRNNFVLLKDNGLWIAPVTFNTNTKERIFDKKALINKNLYKIDQKQIGNKDNKTMTEYKVITELKSGHLPIEKNNNQMTKNKKLVTQVNSVTIGN